MRWKKCVTHENKTAVFVWLLRAHSLGVSHSRITQILSKMPILCRRYYTFIPTMHPSATWRYETYVENPIFDTVKSKFVGYVFDDKVLWLLLVLSNGPSVYFKERCKLFWKEDYFTIISLDY